MGHSMGGHGALTIALKQPAAYRSVSAFAPICNPTQVPWGQKAFVGYLGEDWQQAAAQYDATELVKGYSGPQLPVLMDTGTDDEFLQAQVGAPCVRTGCRVSACRLQLKPWTVECPLPKHVHPAAALHCLRQSLLTLPAPPPPPPPPGPPRRVWRRRPASCSLPAACSRATTTPTSQSPPSLMNTSPSTPSTCWPPDSSGLEAAAGLSRAACWRQRWRAFFCQLWVVAHLKLLFVTTLSQASRQTCWWTDMSAKHDGGSSKQ